MRLCERTRTGVKIAPRVRAEGALGGRAEAFSESMTEVSASILPLEGDLDMEERGLTARARLRILVPADAVVQAGDGVQVEGKMYRVRAVAKWTAHLELDCEEIA